MVRWRITGLKDWHENQCRGRSCACPDFSGAEELKVKKKNGCKGKKEKQGKEKGHESSDRFEARDDKYADRGDQVSPVR